MIVSWQAARGPCWSLGRLLLGPLDLNGLAQSNPLARHAGLHWFPVSTLSPPLAASIAMGAAPVNFSGPAARVSLILNEAEAMCLRHVLACLGQVQKTKDAGPPAFGEPYRVTERVAVATPSEQSLHTGL